MKRRTKKRAAFLVAAAGVAVFIGGFAAGPTDEAGAQVRDPGLDARVEYTVGDTVVDGPAVRNPSCSVSRGFRNTSPVPMLVTARMEWDDMSVEGHVAPVFPRVGDSSYTEPTWLEPGQRVTAVWTNDDFLSEGPVRLLFTGQLAVGDIGANHVEFIPACLTAPVPPPDVTAPPPVDTTPVVVPPSVVEQAPGPEPTPPPSVVVDAGPGPSTVIPTGVLTSVLPPRRVELPVTGPSQTQLILGVGAGLVGLGLLGLVVGAVLRRVGDDYPPVNRDGGL